MVPSHAPNAALLIDFDNVTMGMRSDLSKELKSLLRTDVIRGKVTVQRAYADWRRYPQYIVPLSEASVDLIFAPAYGSSKKNATDIRMAIDGMELVFTRPEIGTFILLTGDSDFSSLVLKLKEYGKYVIGVGIQESSSDILVQNCDEYYSYTSLSGLRKAGSGEVRGKEDPWSLVERAVEQMAKRRDVMRSDRLKQVMLEIDSSFDEKSMGFSKFSRFLTESAQKGLLQLKKLENGQYEVSPPSGGNGGSTASGSTSSGTSTSSSEGGRRGRGRDSGRGRDRDEHRAAAEPAQPLNVVADPESPPPPLLVSSGADLGAEEIASGSAPNTDSETGSVASSEAASPVSAPSVSASVAAGSEFGEPVSRALLEPAYALMVRAIRELAADGQGRAVRDSDVKRRMLLLQSDFSENQLGFPKFSRFLRQAHDHGVIELTRSESGIYEVRVLEGVEGAATSASAAPAEAAGGNAEEKKPSRGRGRGRRKSDEEAEPESAAGDPVEAMAAPAVAKPSASEPPLEERRLRPRQSAGRRGAKDEPPPFLAGQTMSMPGEVKVEQPASSGSVAAATADSRVDGGDDASVEPKVGRSRGRRSSKNDAPKSGATQLETTQTEATPPESKPSAGRQRGGKRPDAQASGAKPSGAKQADAKKPDSKRGEGKQASAGGGARSGSGAPVATAPVGFDPATLGLPLTLEAILEHLVSYAGVGKKTAETLVEALGDRVFHTMQTAPEQIRALLPAARAERVLDEWMDDYAARHVALRPDSSASRPTPPSRKNDGPKGSGGARPRRRTPSGPRRPRGGGAGGGAGRTGR